LPAWLAVIALSLTGTGAVGPAPTNVRSGPAPGTTHPASTGLRRAAAGQQTASAIGADAIFDAIGVRDGITVCEIGAGNGDLTIAAAKIVGAHGHVYTSELGDQRIDALKTRVADSNLPQITVVAGDPNRTNFTDGACDALFMRNVYHHFADPAAMNASIAASLKPGGKAAVVDFRPDHEAAAPAGRGTNGSHGVTPEDVSAEMKTAGFLPQDTQRDGNRFMVVLLKP
jgi:ubiquinone/menaquinone biosynthesis C-methylase UbiE